MAVEDVVRAIMQVQPRLLEFHRPRSRKYPNFRAPANLSEVSTRYTVIDPVLRSLGWDLSDPSCCRVEHRIREPVRNRQGRVTRRGLRVDYALLGPDGHPVVLVEAKRLRLSCRISFSSTDVKQQERAEERRKSWECGKRQLVRYLDSVDGVTAGMLTNGQEWLFIEHMGNDGWKWDRWPIKLTGADVNRSAGLLYDRLAPEFYSQSS